MKKEPVIPFLDTTIALSHELETLKRNLSRLKGRLPEIQGYNRYDYEELFKQNTSSGTGRLGIDWLIKTERAIAVAEEFQLDLTIPSNRAFVSSMVLALT